MADIKFSCPHCQQHIQADSGYGGMQINCPSCKGSLIVPGAAVAPSPPPSPVSAPPPSSLAGASDCPSCGAPLGRGAVLCTKCGYNMATGKRTVAGKVVAAGKPKSDPWEKPWYKTVYPYVGLLVLVMAVLYFLGRENEAMQAAFLGIAALYVLGAHITVAVFAFKDGIGTGFLALCIPIYTVYYVFWGSENDMLKVLYGVAILINIALKFTQF